MVYYSKIANPVKRGVKNPLPANHSKEGEYTGMGMDVICDDVSEGVVQDNAARELVGF